MAKHRVSWSLLVLFLLASIEAAKAQQTLFVPPPGIGSWQDYCKSVLQTANASVLSALDARYVAAGAPGRSPLEVSNGAPVCTPGCEVGAMDEGPGWAGVPRTSPAPPPPLPCPPEGCPTRPRSMPA